MKTPKSKEKQVESKQAGFKYDPKELAAILVKHAGIHEGMWMLTVHFGFGAMNIGPDSGHVPAGAVLVRQVGITEIDVDQDYPVSLTVDAAKINPVISGN